MSSPRPASAPFIQRYLAALFLRRTLYDEVAADSNTIVQAAAVVLVSAISQPTVLLEELGAWALPLMMVFGALRWFVFTAIAYLIASLATRLIGSMAPSYRRLLGCLGFAEAPGLLNLIVYATEEPVTILLAWTVWFWLLAAAIVAVRSALRLPTWLAAAIGVLSFAAYLTPALLVG